MYFSCSKHALSVHATQRQSPEGWVKVNVNVALFAKSERMKIGLVIKTTMLTFWLLQGKDKIGPLI